MSVLVVNVLYLYGIIFHDPNIVLFKLAAFATVKDDLIYGVIKGEKPIGFLYDYDINVETFQITIGNLTTRTVTGNKVQNSPDAVRDINSVRSGAGVVITILKASKIDGDLVSPTNVDALALKIE